MHHFVTMIANHRSEIEWALGALALLLPDHDGTHARLGMGPSSFAALLMLAAAALAIVLTFVMQRQHDRAHAHGST